MIIKKLIWQTKRWKYKRYLRSGKWFNKRKKMFSLVGKKCEMCGGRYRVQVHHMTYKRLYNERSSDLLVVCKYHHDILDKDRRNFWEQQNFAEWVYSCHGDNWRGKTKLYDMAMRYYRINKVNIKSVKDVFGIPVGDLK